MPRTCFLAAALLAALATGCNTGSVSSEDDVSQDLVPDSLPDSLPDSPLETEDTADPCPAGRILCSGTCIDPLSNPDHCGGCDRPCTAPLVCADGGCSQPPDCRETPCPTGYYCNLSDGTCLPGCASSSSCGENADCDIATHRCMCRAGFHDCFGVCYGDADAAHCGMACASCPGDPSGAPVCASGACGIQCNTGYHDCSGVCVDSSSVDHCGASCVPCPADPSGTATCSGTSCGLSCDAGYHDCSGSCLPSDSVESCGTRCTACPGTSNGSPNCTGGDCGFSCDSGYHETPSGCAADCTDDSCASGTYCNPASLACETCPSDPMDVEPNDELAQLSDMQWDSGYTTKIGRGVICPASDQDYWAMEDGYVYYTQTPTLTLRPAGAGTVTLTGYWVDCTYSPTLHWLETWTCSSTSGCTFSFQLAAYYCYYFMASADTVLGYEFSFPYNG